MVFSLVFKISSGEASEGENEPQPGAPEEHVAPGAAATGKLRTRPVLASFQPD